ncbi:MAG: hypothetical protein A2538_05240 [Candidatus Magasanikbacteria bacterium RIFOXYD2_FULL_41_14]|uniref:Uncharacterized protein n=1 Tax=Candidatus Magasanikbacteria bacterium RIFOXYD2_FULL_41_14 TaxID=1798709 RepID=A0A1F6PC23_9BACT|nr:MAG: hypothetical protein A2538_05240 [Candidatus Magasanikbacteria bacterium RIFOXYD2_FULL_41_14]
MPSLGYNIGTVTKWLKCHPRRMRGSRNLAELREPWIPAYAGNDKKRYSATAPYSQNIIPHYGILVLEKKTDARVW